MNYFLEAGCRHTSPVKEGYAADSVNPNMICNFHLFYNRHYEYRKIRKLLAEGDRGLVKFRVLILLDIGLVFR